MVEIPPVAPFLLVLAGYYLCFGYLNPFIRGTGKKIYRKNFLNIMEFIRDGNPQRFRRKLWVTIIFEIKSYEDRVDLEINITKKEIIEISKEMLEERVKKYSENLCRVGNWILILSSVLTIAYFSTKISFLKSLLEISKIIGIPNSLSNSDRAILIYCLIGCLGSMFGGLIHFRGVQLSRIALLKSPP
ncbi:hypothetical protein [Oecophyllibacter saccharovorans]|uniref:hypothetical protein n=1 Tax=Oecophyllibacter saccharovorans TaxID=2558360 RepID=UPI0011676501|nr:hypothetical protein [Oecophyllibacter saccharovorans]TPW36614.1 hypothetical protein E3203_02290 [Oecophyllibacter saccharovorans]